MRERRAHRPRKVLVCGDHHFSGSDQAAATVGPERKHLSADALFSMVHTSFAKIPDHRVGRPAISLADALIRLSSCSC